MGLDMYLTGERVFHTDRSQFRLHAGRYSLGYWRKHPNLHGYLVDQFAGGVDDCRDILLEADDLRQILAAIEAEQLPHTSGFFFGESTGQEKPNDLAIFTHALRWLETPDDAAFRNVSYQASW